MCGALHGSTHGHADKNSFEAAEEVANRAIFAVLARRSSGDCIPVNRHEIIDLHLTLCILALVEHCVRPCRR